MFMHCTRFTFAIIVSLYLIFAITLPHSKIPTDLSKWEGNRPYVLHNEVPLQSVKSMFVCHSGLYVPVLFICFSVNFSFIYDVARNSVGKCGNVLGVR